MKLLIFIVLWVLEVSSFTRTQPKIRLQTSILYARLLGSYEKLLSRSTENNSQSISHSSAFILNGVVDNAKILESIAYSISKHPMMRVKLVKEKTGAQSWELLTTEPLEIAKHCTKISSVDASDFNITWKRLLVEGVNNLALDVRYPRWRSVEITFFFFFFSNFVSP